MAKQNGRPQLPPSIFAADRVQIINAVRTPLGFFTLALLLFYTFIILAGTLFQVSEIVRVILIAAGMLVGVMVIGGVLWLVATRPRNLVFGEQSHLRVQELMAFGSGPNPLSSAEVDRLPPTTAEVPIQGELPPGQPD